MIKDITLGQYFPGNSAIHRLDPRTKLLGMIAYIVIVFLVTKRRCLYCPRFLRQYAYILRACPLATLYAR